MCRVRLAPDETIYVTGEPAGQVVVLRSGRVRIVVQSDEGRKVVIETVRAPSVLGEAALAGDAVHATTAETLTPCELLLVDRDSLPEVVRRRPELASGLLAAMSRRLQTVALRLHDRSLKAVPARLADALLQLADAPAYEVFPVKQSDIAEVAGTSRETATRVLNRFETAGLIALERARVKLLRPDELGRIAAARAG